MANSFANIFKIINKVNESHSDTPVKIEVEKFEKKLSNKTFRPKHTKILMRNKSEDEFNKINKEVKYKSFIGLDEYGKSNSAVGKFGITKDASITRFNKKKTAKNLVSYIPNCGCEIEIEKTPTVSLGNLKDYHKVFMEESYNPINSFYDNLTDDYIENRLSGEIDFNTPRVDNLLDYQNNMVQHQADRDESEKKFRKYLMDLIQRYKNDEITEDEYAELVDIAFNEGMIERIESTFYGKKYQFVMRILKEIYTDTKFSSYRTNTLDNKYGIDESIIPIVRNQCPNLKSYQQKYITSLIRGLTTYSSHEEIRNNYKQVFIYMMSICINDKKEDVTVEELFDNFTMIIAPKYQAIVMAEISILAQEDIQEINSTTLGEISTLLRNYIEVLPTKVEALFLYLDRKYELNHDCGELLSWKQSEDILNVLPVGDWLKQQYPAIYSMLVDIGKRATQYADLFKDSKLD